MGRTAYEVFVFRRLPLIVALATDRGWTEGGWAHVDSSTSDRSDRLITPFIRCEAGYRGRTMRREHIDRKQLPRKRKLPEILPLDPRDPDIVHAKELMAYQAPRRRAV